MRSRYRILEPDRAHFITSTIVDWLPVFTTPACCDILVQSFDYCRNHKQLRIHGWVIMDNHIHALVAGPQLSGTIADWKKFTARALVAQINREGRTWLLERLHWQKASHKTNSQHQVWQEGFHPQAILDDAMMLQKLEYIHNNPVRRGWIASPEHWRYSSAHEWLEGAAPVLRCDPWR
jgi:REP element-mobilizing transposase RayT